jgi:hypothetical protein
MAPVELSVMESFEYHHSVPFWDVVTQTVCIGVSTVCVGMRMHARIVLVRASGWEDCMFVLSGVHLFPLVVYWLSC